MKSITFQSKQIIIFFFIIFSEIGLTQDLEFWGLTQSGGQFKSGTIFKTNNEGLDHTIEESIYSINCGNSWSSLCEDNNGKLWGLASSQFFYDEGAIYEYDPILDSIIIKFWFDGPERGSIPKGDLLLANNGLFYGMTSKGGLYDLGVLFSYNSITDEFIKIIDFSGEMNGSNPWGSLVELDENRLIGMTASGGDFNKGTIFTFNINTNNFIKQFSFNGTNGQSPRGKLLKYDDNIVYGLASYGGQNGAGTIFRYDLSLDIFEVKHHFNGSNSRNPAASLIKASNGKLYGTTEYGGGNGSIFEYDPENYVFSNLFNLSRPTTGYRPLGNLLEIENNKLYGLVAQGGVNDNGVLFYYDIEEYEFHKLIDFESDSTGSGPFGSLMKTSNNKVYGLTMTGGAFRGVLFEYLTENNQIDIKVKFHDAPNGAFPLSNIEKLNDSIFIGITNLGGERFKDGVIYSYNINSNEFVKLYDFNGYENGGANRYGFVLTSQGKMYGCTSYWSLGNLYTPVIFEFDIHTLDYKVLYESENRTLHSVCQYNETILYGLTIQGGDYGAGTIFKFDINDSSYIKIHDFDGSIGGKWPYCELTMASNNKLYGVTEGGGEFSGGAIYCIDPINDSIEVIFSFENNTTGNRPYEKLMEFEEGIFYGLNSGGGLYGKGVLFKFDYNTYEFTKIIDFDGVNYGANPRGELMRASNGKLYGMTYQGGENDKGVLFEYDIENNVFNKKLDFNGENGEYPEGHLLEMGVCIPDSISPKINELPIIYSDCVVEHIQSPIAISSCGDLIYGTTDFEFPITAQDTSQILWVFEDNYGNYLEQNQLVVIKDTIGPSIIYTDSIELYVNDDCQVTIPDLISQIEINDNCSLNIASQVPLAGTIFEGVNNQSINILIEAVDINGNVSTLNINVPIIDDNEIEIINVETNNISCFGNEDGVININVSNFNEDLLYSIDNINYENMTGYFDNLTPDLYFVSVKNSNSCIYQYENNPVIIYNAQPIEFSNVEIENESCDGALGSIIIEASGGTGELIYSVNNGQDYQESSVFNNLIADTYVIRIKDDNSCTKYFPDNPVVVRDLNPSYVVINSDPYGVVCLGEELSLEANAFEAISYVWSNGETGNQIIISESEAGLYNYICTVVNLDGCESSGNIEILWDDCIGLQELIDRSIEFEVFPNPINKTLNIRLLGDISTGSLEIYNSQGKLLFENIISQQIEINSSNWNSGFYLIKILKNNTQYYYKIIKL